MAQYRHEELRRDIVQVIVSKKQENSLLLKRGNLGLFHFQMLLFQYQDRGVRYYHDLEILVQSVQKDSECGHSWCEGSVCGHHCVLCKGKTCGHYQCK